MRDFILSNKLNLEEITNVDLVRAQLLLSLPGTLLSSVLQHPIVQFPVAYAIQLRLNAENPTDAFRPSTGTIRASQLSWPGGRGVRVDTWLTSARVSFEEPVWNIGSDFDSLLAKIIVRGRTFEEATQRAKRALRETRIQSDIKTNLDVLAGVVGHKDWVEGTIDTLWLERSVQDVLQVGRTVLEQRSFLPQTSQNLGSSSGAGSAFVSPGTVLLQPGTSFQLELINPTSNDQFSAKHILTIPSIAHNAFPRHLSGTLQTSLFSSPLQFSLTQSSSLASSSFEFADPHNAEHIASPFNGKIVELHPALQDAALAVGAAVRAGDALVVISAMKMESVIAAPRSGTVKKIGKGIQGGAIVGEGVLICVLESIPVTAAATSEWKGGCSHL